MLYIYILFLYASYEVLSVRSFLSNGLHMTKKTILLSRGYKKRIYVYRSSRRLILMLVQLVNCLIHFVSLPFSSSSIRYVEQSIEFSHIEVKRKTNTQLFRPYILSSYCFQSIFHNTLFLRLSSRDKVLSNFHVTCNSVD